MADMAMNSEDLATMGMVLETLSQVGQLLRGSAAGKKSFITKLYGDETVLVDLIEDEEYEMEDALTHEVFVATLMLILRFRGKRYALFHAPGDPGKIDVFALRLETDKEGFDELRDITKAEKEFIGDFLQVVMARGAIEELKKKHKD